ALLPSAKIALTISRSRRVRCSGLWVVCDICRILVATNVACQDLLWRPGLRARRRSLRPRRHRSIRRRPFDVVDLEVAPRAASRLEPQAKLFLERGKNVGCCR